MDDLHRHRVTLTLDGTPARHGWWGVEDVAREKYRLWVGECSGQTGSSVTLTDEQTGTVLTTWPDTP